MQIVRQQKQNVVDMLIDIFAAHPQKKRKKKKKKIKKIKIKGNEILEEKKIKLKIIMQQFVSFCLLQIIAIMMPYTIILYKKHKTVKSTPYSTLHLYRIGKRMRFMA